MVMRWAYLEAIRAFFYCRGKARVPLVMGRLRRAYSAVCKSDNGPWNGRHIAFQMSSHSWTSRSAELERTFLASEGLLEDGNATSSKKVCRPTLRTMVFINNCHCIVHLSLNKGNSCDKGPLPNQAGWSANNKDIERNVVHDATMRDSTTKAL